MPEVRRCLVVVDSSRLEQVAPKGSKVREAQGIEVVGMYLLLLRPIVLGSFSRGRSPIVVANKVQSPWEKELESQEWEIELMKITTDLGGGGG